MVVKDVTLREVAWQQYYQALIEEISEQIYCFDLEGRLAVVNEAYCYAVGYKKSELIGTHFSSFIYPQDRARVIDKTATLSPDNPQITYKHRLISFIIFSLMSCWSICECLAWMVWK